MSHRENGYCGSTKDDNGELSLAIACVTGEIPVKRNCLANDIAARSQMGG